MPKNRYIDTKFWSDSYIVSLNPLERYLFMYFLTNEHTNIAGIYELPIRVIAFESGLDESVLPAMLKKFQDDKKIYYIDEWIIICNFPKHQESEKSPKIREGITNALNLLPPKVRFAMDTLSIPYLYPSNYLNLNLNLNLNLTPSASPSGFPLKEKKLASETPDDSKFPLNEEEAPKTSLTKIYNQMLDRMAAKRSEITNERFAFKGLRTRHYKALKRLKEEFSLNPQDVFEKWDALCYEYNDSKFLQSKGFDIYDLITRLTKKG